MAVKPTVTRRYGSTYVSAWAEQDVKDDALAWGWVLPWTVTFSLNELAAEVRRSHDADNPKTARDLAVLEGPVRTFEEVRYG